MKQKVIKVSCVPVALVIFSVLCTSAKAQIIPDSSLNNSPSIVIPNQVINGVSSDLITGGASRGATLFHSFQEFNVNAGQGAYFNNPDEITNILTRVTGSNSSNILGTLGVLGQSNLFFLNPKGIIFGPGAQLNLKGSFFATTATEFHFPDGSSFSAVNPQNAPVLTVSVPVGLGFTGNSGPIEVQGVGHTLSKPFTVVPVSIIGAGSSTIGLRVQPGKTIALLGGNVFFNGGIVTAPMGRIEIASIHKGRITTSNFFSGEIWNVDYSNIQSFQNVGLTNLSLLDASGTDSGDISLKGNEITLVNGSLALSESQGFSDGGNINVDAAESLSIYGNTSNPDPNNFNPTKLQSGIVTVSSTGQSANINISTRKLLIQSAGGILSSSLVSDFGGNITVKASDSVSVVGSSPVDPNINSTIATNSAGSSNSGNIAISTKNFLVQDGGVVGSGTFGTGLSGEITVNALESTVIKGTNPFIFLPSLVATSSLGSGAAGNLYINTPQLTVLDGAAVSTSIVTSGGAGNLKINAPEFIKVSGFAENKLLSENQTISSTITSSAILLDPLSLKILGLPPIVTGRAGSVTIETAKLLVDKKGEVSVRNDGTGDAGTLEINANSINLDNQGGITATTASGQGGNVTLNSKDILLRDNSNITATAGLASTGGNGGNITISTDTLAALKNSDITANAFEGRGGNIQINTQGLFRSSNSDITASSLLGLNGVVEISTADIDFQNSLTEFATNFVTTEQVIAGSCLARRNQEQGTFVITGNGGLPINPYSGIEEWDTLTGPQPNEGDSVVLEQQQPVQIQKTEPIPTKWKLGDPIVEAQGIVKTADGRTLVTTLPQKAAPLSADKLVCPSN